MFSRNSFNTWSTAGGTECVVFNSTYANARELCVTDRILIVKGRVHHK